MQQKSHAVDGRCVKQVVCVRVCVCVCVCARACRFEVTGRYVIMSSLISVTFDSRSHPGVSVIFIRMPIKLIH